MTTWTSGWHRKLWVKKVTLCSCPQLCPMLIDFQNSSTDILSKECAKDPTTPLNVATLPDGLYCSTSCVIIQWPKQRKWQILTPTSLKPLRWFWLNVKLEGYPHAKFDFDPTMGVVWANIWFATIRFLYLYFFLSFLVSLSRAQVTLVN